MCLGLATNTQSQTPIKKLENKDTIALNNVPPSDSVSKKSVQTVPIAKDGLSEPVDYQASDSIIVDNPNNLMFLYDKAVIKYQKLELKADSVVIDMKNSVAFAGGMRDSTGKVAGKPEFKESSQEFKANALRYNFKTKKGIIYEARSKQGDMYVLGEKSKIVAQGTDSAGVTKNVVYSKNAFLTTCSAEHPHFGILSSKQKIIPDELAVIGPSSLVLGGVPIPIIPFGFFPLSKNKRAGLIIPRDYEFSQAWGFGIRNIGYYTPISDNQDLTLTGDVFFNLTYGIHAVHNYKKRYRFNSRLGLDFASNRNENAKDGTYARTNAIGIRFSLNQESGAHPSETWSGSVNITTNSFDRVNSNNFNSVTNNSLNSNLSFSKRFPNKPYYMAVSLTHTQNISNRKMTISFPNVNFNTETLFPFKNSSRGGAERWYDKINFQYTGVAKNTFETTDTTLFTKKTLDDARFGASHTISTGASFNVFKYFQISPSINYIESWNFKTARKVFDPTLNVKTDTTFNRDSTDYTLRRDTTFGKQNSFMKSEFRALRQVSAGVSMQTKIYGMLWQSSRGWLRGVRHVMTPSVSMGFSPDYNGRTWNYFDTVSTDARAAKNQIQKYSYFDNGLFGTPSQGGKQMALSYAITNNFEAKYRGRRDTADTKVKLLENVSINGNYNFAADSFRWSRVQMSTNTNLFKGFTNVSLTAVFSPYAAAETGDKSRDTKQLLWDKNKQVIRFAGAQIGVTTRFSLKQIREIFTKKIVPDTSKQATQLPRNNQVTKNKGSFLELFDNFSIDHYMTFVASKNTNGRDTFRTTTNSLRTAGSIKITNKWSIDIRNIGYDFINKTLTYPDLGFTRDLHCWEMGASWQPDRGTYTFFIRVKPSTLGFIDLPYNRTVTSDGFKGF